MLHCRVDSPNKNERDAQPFSMGETKQNPRETIMKKILLASACIFALATPAAFAQTAQPIWRCV